MRRKLARIALGVYIATLLVLCFGDFSGIQAPAEDILGLPFDKLVHFMMFLPFPFIFSQAFVQGKSPWAGFAVTLAAGLLLAAATELGQTYLTSTREGNGADFLADAVSLTLCSAALLLHSLRKLNPKQ